MTIFFNELDQNSTKLLYFERKGTPLKEKEHL